MAGAGIAVIATHPDASDLCQGRSASTIYQVGTSVLSSSNAPSTNVQPDRHLGKRSKLTFVKLGRLGWS